MTGSFPGTASSTRPRCRKHSRDGAPKLIRIETRAGHGAGVPTTKIIADYADRWAFLVRNLGMRLPEGYGEKR